MMFDHGILAWRPTMSDQLRPTPPQPHVVGTEDRHALAAASVDVKEDLMDTLVLEDSQTRLVLETDGPLTVRDRSGRELGVLIQCSEGASERISLSPDELDEINRRMANREGQLLTTQEVLTRLKARAAQ